MKKMTWLGIVVMVVGLCSSGALATTIGPPVAGLDAGQFSIGLEYYMNDIGTDIDGTEIQTFTIVGEPEPDKEMRDDFKDELDFESDMIFVKLGYGVSDKLEVFLRLGMADATIDDAEISGGSDFAYGLGAKATFYEEGDLKIGALLQMTWGSSDDKVTETIEDPEDEDNFVDFPLPIDIDYYQLKFAVGPTYKLMESLSVYGGPFYHMMSGNLDGDATFSQLTTSQDLVLTNVTEDLSVDIETSSSFGGYIGAQIDLAENIPLCIEYQFTGDADVLGASLVYKF